MAQSDTQSRASDQEVDKLRDLVREAELAGLPEEPMGGRRFVEVPSMAEPFAPGRGHGLTEAKVAVDTEPLAESETGVEKATQREVQVLGRRSLERVEQLHLRNLELTAERDGLAKKLEEARHRAAEFEELNLQLDQQVAKLEAERMQLLELQQKVDRRDVTITSMRADKLRQQQALSEQQQRSLEIQRQLRAINQERSTRIAAIKSKLQGTMQTNVELERQIDDLVGYRQRAAECITHLNGDLKRVLRDNRVKARRLAEARAVLKDIEQRLGTEVG